MKSIFTKETLPLAVKSLFEQNNYEVFGPKNIHGAEVDLIAKPLADPFAIPIYIEVTIEYVDNDKYGKDVGKLAMIRAMDPITRCLIVSSSGFSLPVIERANATRIDTLTYDDLFSKFERFQPYVETILGEGFTGSFLSELDSVYEEPLFDDSVGANYATSYLTDWRDAREEKSKWLIIIGEYGTGKTALTQVLQYRWVKEYHSNARLPIPFRLELRDFTKQFDARGLLHYFLDRNKLGHIPIDFVISLIRAGRVILLLDGYDEMAQYMNSRERRTCLETLAELSANGAKGILTSRPNYFSETEEFQVFEVLYASLTKGKYHLSALDREAIEKEKSIDELIVAHFLNRNERILKDLSPAQTEALVRRKLADNQEGCNIILNLLRRIFRPMDDGSNISLSGKPVIIGYLLEVIDELKDYDSGESSLSLTEWEVYKLIVDKLMLRDFRRSPNLLPDQRRRFLHSLSLWLSTRDNAVVTERNFRDLVNKEFKNDIRRSLPEDREQVSEKLFSDLRSSTTLTRSSDSKQSGWHFSHNSLREYLLAEFFIDQLRQGNIPHSVVPVSDPMRIFVASRSKDDLHNLLETITKLWQERKNHSGIGQILSLSWDGLYRLYADQPDPVKSMLESICGEKVLLNDISIRRIKMSSFSTPADLSGANFTYSELSEIDFSGAYCCDADFSNSLLDSISFNSADIQNAKFTNSILIDVEVSGANFSNADFRAIDKSSTILVQSSSSPQRIRLEGLSALGYLRYFGAYTDSVPSIYIFKNHRNYCIVEKICEEMASQTAHQLLGLEQRGKSQQDPGFARNFINHILKHSMASSKRNRPGMIWTTPKGREIFGCFCEGKQLPVEIEAFLRDN